MLKQLYLLSESILSDYIKSSKDLKLMAVGMSAEDIRKNTEYIFEQTLINEIPENGVVKLDIDAEGIAHIPIVGMLANNVTPSASFFGESITTYNFITESIRLAEETQQVKEIFLEVNSGGGHAEGVEPASNAIFNASKKTTARVHFMAASGAYWLASQVDHITAAGKLSSFGSIGVATEFVDRSKSDEARGIKRIILTSSDAPQKRIDITTDKGQAVVVERMDEIHSVFVDQIIRGRAKAGKSITAKFINENFGKGGVMAADRALKNGMIDSIEGEETTSSTTNKTFSINSQTQTKEKTMDEKEFLAFLAKNEGALEAHQKIVADSKTEPVATLQEFLGLNAEAKTEHENAVAEAGKNIETGKISKSDAKFAISLVKNYSASTQEAVEGYFCGENDLKMIKMLASNEDMMNEKLKSLGVQQNQPGATPAGGVLTEEIAAKGQTMKSVEVMKAQLGNTNKVL